jgi:hypothetical protein
MPPKTHAALATLLAATHLLACDKPEPAAPAPAITQRPTDRPDDAPPWIAPEQPAIPIVITAQGPTAAAIPIAPTLDGAAAPWTIDGQTLSQQARWHDATLAQTWRIADGDPTLRAVVTLDKLPAQALEGPLTLTLTLPAGDVDIVDDAMNVTRVETSAATHAWTPGWVRWRAGERTITFTYAGGERMEVTREASGVTLRWTLWSPQAHPLTKNCGPQLKDWSLAARWEVTWGDRAPVLPSRLPGGAQAALAPVFIDPALTGRKDLKEGAALSAQDWLTRTRTLVHGHSASTDPRFGNGGLLGGQLGGTISAPSKIAGDLAVQSYAKELPDRVEIAAEDSAGATLALFSGQPDCQHLARPGAGLAPVALALGGVTSKLPDMLTAAPGVAHDVPLTADVPSLNGQRATLTTTALSRAALQNLQRQRGLSWFATPLVATRNPLVAAARESLLDPERQGNWTLHPELAAALGEVELLQESETLMFAPVSLLVRHWRAAQRVQINPLPDGSWLLHNPGAPIPAFTLIAPDALAIATPPGGDDKTTGEGPQAQRWLWLDLPSGFTRLTSPAAPISPVRWSLAPL